MACIVCRQLDAPYMHCFMQPDPSRPGKRFNHLNICVYGKRNVVSLAIDRTPAPHADLAIVTQQHWCYCLCRVGHHNWPAVAQRFSQERQGTNVIEMKVTDDHYVQGGGQVRSRT